MTCPFSGTFRRRAVFAAACTLLLGSPLSAQRTAPDWTEFDRYVDQAARDWRVPGMAIAVVHGDSLVFARGYGVAEAGKPARATEHTRFAVGSTTKAMTTAALAMLVDEGKLRWDDRVIDHVPELQLYDAYATRELTVRDLLTHRSGLPGTDLLWSRRANQYPMTEMVRRLRHVRPTSSFRSTFAYQNVVYSIGGLLIERISGRTWDEFLRERLFAPLAMRATEPLVAGIIGKADVAVPHGLAGDSVRVVPIRTTDAVASAGSVWSSVSDMSRWMRFMLDSGRVGQQRLIAPATFNEIVAPQIRVPMAQYPALELARPHFFSYGLGWFVQDYGGRTVWMHTGSIDGMSAIVGLLPAERVGVVVLANLDHAELRHALMYQVFDLFGAAPRRDWSAELRALFATRRAAAAAAATAAATASQGPAAPSLPLAQYAGTYADSAFGRVEIRIESGALHARFERDEIGPLSHWRHDTFRRPARAAEGPLALTFVPDGAGGISAVRAFGITFARERNPG